MNDDERDREPDDGDVITRAPLAAPLRDEEHFPTISAIGDRPWRETVLSGIDAPSNTPLTVFPQLGGADEQQMEDMIAARLFPKRVAPVKISRYSILDKLGNGGMGVVFAAYDPQLDRKVAIKLLRSEHLSVSAEARLYREAQAMAKVVHANVISVIEVGVHEGQTYVVMEHIRGQSLATWPERKPGWPETLAVYCQAGHGLAAAHRAGVIHRDFKPHNAMLVEEGVDAGRVKVLDFGLAQASVSGSSDSCGFTDGEAATMSMEGDDKSLRAERLTATGALIGTPAYMAPEQFVGLPASALSDQYSFAASLYEALYGALPFTGESLAELTEVVLNGEPASPPSDTEVPKWVHQVLLRGLSRDPAERFPSVEVLCEALTRDPSARRKNVWFASSVLCAVIGTSVWSLTSLAGRESPCQGRSFELREVWSPERAAALHTSFIATEAPLAEESAGRASSLLDRYAAEWSSTRVEACQAHRVGEVSAKLLDLQMACLGRRRAGLFALTDLFVDADQEVVKRAVEAALALPRLSACADADALLEASPGPEDPALAEQVQELREEFASITALASAGLLDEAASQGAALLERVTPLEQLALSAEVNLGLGTIDLDRRRPEAAEAALSRSLSASLEIGADRIAAEALLRRLFVRGGLLGDAPGAAADEAIATPLADRYADDPHLRWLLLNNLGAVRLRQGELDTAEVLLLQAMAMERGPSTVEAAGTLANLGMIACERRDFSTALEHYRGARRLVSEALGREHPLVVSFRSDEASVLLELGRLEEAYSELRALLDRPGADTSAHLGVWARINLSSLEHRRRRDAVARELAEEAISLLGETDPYALAYAEIALGCALAGIGEALAAKEHRRRGINIAESNFGVSAVALTVLILAGQDAGGFDDIDAIIEDLRRALRSSEASFGLTPAMTALNQRFLADALLLRDAPLDSEEALVLATTATATLRGLDYDVAVDLGNAELTRGRALLGAGEPAAAIVALRESLAQLSPRVDHESPHLADVQALLARAIEGAGSETR